MMKQSKLTLLFAFIISATGCSDDIAKFCEKDFEQNCDDDSCYRCEDGVVVKEVCSFGVNSINKECKQCEFGISIIKVVEKEKEEGKEKEREEKVCRCPSNCTYGCYQLIGGNLRMVNNYNKIIDKEEEIKYNKYDAKDNKDKIGVCIEKNGCIKNENEINGECKRADNCKLGWEEDGSCYGCKLGKDDVGQCKKEEGCFIPDEWNDDGLCKKVEGCKKGWKPDGQCDQCAIDNDDNGQCKKEEGCFIPGEWNDDGSCKKVVGCNLGWEDDGQCAGCILGNDATGQCAKASDCFIKNLWESDGTCKKVDGCENGNKDTGECDNCAYGNDDNGRCKEPLSCLSDSNCEEYTYCKGELCYCNDSHSCILIDSNHNNMDDRKEDLTLNDNTCHTSDDCSDQSQKELFCDSFIGYKCSTMCTTDDECVDGFVCRKDGRCASESFTTVWDKKGIKKDEKMIFMWATKGENSNEKIRICWDWRSNREDSGKDGKGCLDNTNCFEEYELDTKAYYDDGHEAEGYYVISNTYDNIRILPENITIKILGELDGVLTVQTSKDYLLEIQSFGKTGFSPAAFEGCTKLKKLSSIDIPDSTKLTTMNYMFTMNTSLNSPMNQWDVSNVVDFEKAFAMIPHGKKECQDSVFNPSMSDWDVSNAEIMKEMFECTRYFNQDLSKWNVSKVKNMKGMFSKSGFNKSLKKWDVTNVTDMTLMFAGNLYFNSDIFKFGSAVVDNMFDTSILYYDFQNAGEKKGTKICDLFNQCKIDTERNGECNIINTNLSDACGQ